MFAIFKHPERVCMTYGNHMLFSLNCSYIMFTGSIKAFIHAFIPDIYIASSTKVVNKLQKLIKDAGCQD